MTRVLAGLTLSLVLCGCVGMQTIPIEASVTRKFAGMTITNTKRARPDFSAGAVGQFLLGGLGIVPTLAGEGAMEHFGNVIATENDLEDPAGYIGATLIAELSQKYGLTPIENSQVLVADESAKQLSVQFANSRFLLDVRTIDWGLVNHPVKWGLYGVRYNAKLRVIDTASAKVIAESFCMKQPFATRPDLTREELLANHGQQLKEELRVAAEYCTEEFRTKALKQPPAPNPVVP